MAVGADGVTRLWHFRPRGVKARRLFAGEDGMAFYRRLAMSSATWILTEIGDGQSSAVIEVFGESGWRLTSTRNDLSGTPRVLEFRRGE